MKWVALLLLGAPQGAGEEKGTFLLTFFGKPAGTESYRIESFEEGHTVLFTQSKFTVEVQGRARKYVVDTVLTTGPGFAPIRYAAYHKAGREERESKLDWKKGHVLSTGKRRVRSGAAFVLDNHVIAHYLPILRKGRAAVRTFSPARFMDVDVRIEEGEEVALRGDGREVRAREMRLRVGSLRLTAYVDGKKQLIRLECPSLGLLAEREGFGGLVPGIGGTLTRPEGKGPFPAVVLLGEKKEGADCGDAAVPEFLPALARALAGAGVLVLRPEGTDVAAAVAGLRARDDVGSVSLVGHGGGGRTAARAAARDPGIRALVLLSVPTRPLEEVLLGRLERQLREQEAPEAVRRGILEKQRKIFAAVRAAEGDTLEIDERRTPVAALRERLAFDLGATVGRVKGAVVFLHGTEDGCVEAGDAEDLARACPSAKVHRFDGKGHSFGPADGFSLKRLVELTLESLR